MFYSVANCKPGTGVKAAKDELCTGKPTVAGQTISGSVALPETPAAPDVKPFILQQPLFSWALLALQSSRLECGGNIRGGD